MSTLDDYPSSIYSPEFQPKEHAFIVYPHQIQVGQPQENQKAIGASNFILNWPVYDGTTPDAKLVARLQGIYSNADRNGTVKLVFSDERFPSTLTISGYLEGTNELAILDGTGEFAMAQGFVKARHYTTSPASPLIREFQIRAMVPTLGKSVTTPTPVTKNGPWGGNGGDELDITVLPLHLESLTIGSGDVVDSLAFSYIDQAGNRRTTGPWGGDGGLKKTIQLAPNETVNKIFGTTGDFGGITVITCISVTTSLRTYGPFGKERGTHFSTADGNNIIVGFFVRAGLFVDNLGVYVRNK